MRLPNLFQSPVRHDHGAPTLELRDVTVMYDGDVALRDVDLVLNRGDQVAVVGPNGAGKSTLLNVIVGITKPRRGEVRVYGSGPQGHICVGYVPQRNRIDWRFPVSVRDVVLMGRIGRMGLFRWPGRRDHAHVAAALEQVGMADYAQRQIGELSGGQQQRVFLARALAQEAELLLLDEPLTGLDMPSQEAILQILASLKDAGMTFLIATHDLNQAANQFSHMLLLNRRVVGFGAPEAVLTPDNLALAYGDSIHVVPTADGQIYVADTCCGGGHAPVATVLGSRLAENGEHGHPTHGPVTEPAGSQTTANPSLHPEREMAP